MLKWVRQVVAECCDVGCDARVVWRWYVTAWHWHVARWQVVEKCFSREVDFVITNRQSSATLQQSFVDNTVYSPSSVVSPSAAAAATSPRMLKVRQATATRVFDSSPAAVSSPAEHTAGCMVCCSHCAAEIYAVNDCCLLFTWVPVIE